ncbi:MAG: hypothetical protein ACRCZ2_00645 [Fusobacteriaceae bacterium]
MKVKSCYFKTQEELEYTVNTTGFFNKRKIINIESVFTYREIRSGAFVPFRDGAMLFYVEFDEGEKK